MKIFPIVDVQSNWIPKILYESFSQGSSLVFVDNVHDADIAWIMSYYLPDLVPPRFELLSRMLSRIGIDQSSARAERLLSNKLVITTIAHLYHPKEDLFIEKVRRADQVSDVIHFFSIVNIHANQHYFTKPILHLPYWLDTSRFYPLSSDERAEIRSQLGIPAERIVIGSFQRDTESDRETPKLEKGPDQFCGVIETLDTEKHFVLLAGPRRDYIEKRLDRYGMPYKSLGFVPQEDVNNLYNVLDYYLVTSRAEGGPQAILEAMAAKTRIYSTRVGVSHLLDDRVVFDQVDEIAAALLRSYPDVLEQHYERIQEHSPDIIIPQYELVFEQLYNAFQKDHARLPEQTPSLAWFNLRNQANDNDR